MASYNRIVLVGNLTRDPEIRYAPSGVPVAKFGMAVNTKTRKGDDLAEETCFVDVTAFNRLAETVSEYLKKGRSVLVEGRLQYETWEKDGVKRSKHAVVADRVEFLGAAAGENGNAARAPRQDEDPDDVPF